MLLEVSRHAIFLSLHLAQLLLEPGRQPFCLFLQYLYFAFVSAPQALRLRLEIRPQIPVVLFDLLDLPCQRGPDIFGLLLGVLEL